MSYIQAAKLGRHALASLLTVTIRIETLPSFFPAYEVLPIGAKRDCCCSTLVVMSIQHVLLFSFSCYFATVEAVPFLSLPEELVMDVNKPYGA